MLRHIRLTILLLLLACCDHNDPTEEAPIAEPAPTEKPEGQLFEYPILPQSTDANIRESAESHYAYLDTRVESRRKLLVFLSGTNSFPSNYQRFSKVGAELGYHVINLNYLNSVGVTKCLEASDQNCFTNFHEEVIFGSSSSEWVNVDESNSIYNRIIALLRYLDAQYPAQGWSQFLEGDALHTKMLVLAGHSQGGGHAAYLAYKFRIHRLIVFAAPNDYSEKYKTSASWCRAEFATSPENFFGLMHQRDEIAPSEYQYQVWKDMKMLVVADTASVTIPSFANHQAFVTNAEPNASASPRLKHNVPVRDDALPGGVEGERLVGVWKFMLK